MLLARVSVLVVLTVRLRKAVTPVRVCAVPENVTFALLVVALYVPLLVQLPFTVIVLRLVFASTVPLEPIRTLPATFRLRAIVRVEATLPVPMVRFLQYEVPVR